MRLFLALLVFVSSIGSAYAQTDPRTLPLLTSLSGITVKPSMTYDWPDGAGGDISYGGGALGVSEDGKFLYISCVRDDAGIAKLEIVPGGRMRVVQPCLGPTKSEIAKVHPDPSAFRPMLGGVLELNGRMTVTGYVSYDASGMTTSSHWSGPTLTALTGPWAGTVAPGLVKSQMGPVPPIWRQYLGGPALASAGYTSIISRASYGASVSVFDPATVTANGFPMKMLLGCPHSVLSCITYGTPTSNDYNGSELSGGFFIAPGTRTLVVIERESSGPTCYGYATRNQADHGKPYLDAVYCYSLTDPMDQKGPKGYPYRLVAKLYDLLDLIAVNQGTKTPWSIKQYATLDMPGSNPGEYVTSGAFNYRTGEYYMIRYAGGGVNTVYVYGGFGTDTSTPPPTPTDCVPGTTVYTFVSATQCVGSGSTGIRTVTESWVRTGDIPPTNGGLACQPTTGTSTRDEACVPPPPPPVPEFSGRIRAQSLVTAGLRLTLDVNAAAPVPPIGTAVKVLVNNIAYDATVFDVDLNYYAGTPKSTRVIVTIPGLSFLAVTVQVP